MTSENSSKHVQMKTHRQQKILYHAYD